MSLGRRCASLFSRENQMRSGHRAREICLAFDRGEAGFSEPVGVLRERPALAAGRVRELVDGEAQRKGRAGALLVGEKIVDRQETARSPRLESGLEEFLISLLRLEA